MDIVTSDDINNIYFYPEGVKVEVQCTDKNIEYFYENMENYKEDISNWTIEGHEKSVESFSYIEDCRGFSINSDGETPKIEIPKHQAERLNELSELVSNSKSIKDMDLLSDHCHSLKYAQQIQSELSHKPQATPSKKIKI